MQERFADFRPPLGLQQTASPGYGYRELMGLFKRKDRLPAEVRSTLTLTADDRILGQSLLADGSWAVATQHTLQHTDGTTTLCRAWCDVDRGTWDPDTSTLTATWVDGSPALSLQVADPTKTAFLRVFRERVQASVILSETIELGNGLTARAAVRKDSTDHLFTQVVADDGANLSTPEAQVLIRAAMSRLRRASGASPEA